MKLRAEYYFKCHLKVEKKNVLRFPPIWGSPHNIGEVYMMTLAGERGW